MIAQHFPKRDLRIADVASGKGQLQAALRQLGYRKITSWDKRCRNAKNRYGYRYGHFDHRNAPKDYDLIVGMHPDEGTDHIILYAVKHQLPFMVCPCCIKPSGTSFGGVRQFENWMQHLRLLAAPLKIQDMKLPMMGRSAVLLGRPPG